jgi:NAD(P)-dependent dehydrogenase (short-subunit alcohol dehydrogenase family)
LQILLDPMRAMTWSGFVTGSDPVHQRPSAIVVTAPGDIGSAVAAGLRDRGWPVAMVEAAHADPGGPHGIAASFAQAATGVATVGLVVDCLAAQPGPAQPMADCPDDIWTMTCEDPLRIAWFVAMAARDALRPTGGAYVVVLPVGSLAGRPGQAAFGALLEGRRTLVKSAARQWGHDRIRVNAVAVDLEGKAASRWPAALGHVPDIRDDIAAFLELIADDRCRVLTGATMVVDGGTVMVP